MNSNCVILADSHQDMLEGIRGLLKTAFESVVMVADEKSLFDVVEKLNPDIAVVDLSLPVSGEANIARKIKIHHPDLKFIILSVHDETTAINEIMSEGAAGFVFKRSTATDLMLAVDEILKGHTFISPSFEA
ncbi:MAG: response regulator [Planctomycetota bacterium]|jgi:DNA-binding NarL/FixJ family response regulator